MSNLGENYSPFEAPQSKFTSEFSDGFSNASLDYYKEAMNGFFTRLRETLSQSGINLHLPQSNIFDSGNSQGSPFGGNSDGGVLSCGPHEVPQPPRQQPPQDQQPECDDNGQGDGNSDGEGTSESSNRTPYNRKELGAQLLMDNFDAVDLDGDGFLRRAEIQDYKRSLNGSLEKQGVQKVLNDLERITRLSNDQRGREIGASSEDLTELIGDIQRKGELHGYPAE